MTTVTLSIKYPSERDSNIEFSPMGHRYSIVTDRDGKYTSVTTWVHSHFPKFDADKIIDGMMRKVDWQPGHKYWGMTKSQIKNLWRQNGASVSSAGTGLHADIERFMNIPNTHNHRDLLEQFTESCNEDEKETSVEWEYFINFVRDFPFMTPYRTEWMIYDEELKIAGSVDMVYLNDDGTVSIYDWKRCQNIVRVNVYNKFALTPCISELHDTNYWHYSLQLNLYKYIIESKYNRLVSSMYLVQLHPDVDECNYVLHEVYPMTEGFHELMTDRKRFVESGAM